METNEMSHKCRICIEEGASLLNIFPKRGQSKIAINIMTLAKVEVSPNDGLPSKICSDCYKKLKEFINFKNLCEETDAKLRCALNDSGDDVTDQDFDSKELSIPIFNKINDFSINYKTDDCSVDIKNEHNIECKSNIEKENKKIKNVKKQQCFTCGKIMSSKFRLKTHLRTHTGERPYSCPHCCKNFSLAQNLKVHLRVHTGEKPLECKTCGATFAQSAGLAAHRRKHTGQTPYQCVLCPRSFRTVGHLQYHIRRHTGEKNFECDTCGKAFITRSDLKQHFQTHTGDRPHVCCVCGARMTRASHLKRHMQHAHNGQYTCKVCTAKFKEKVEFDEHLKTHESNEKADSVE